MTGPTIPHIDNDDDGIDRQEQMSSSTHGDGDHIVHIQESNDDDKKNDNYYYDSDTYTSHDHNFAPPPPPSTSMLRVLCLHDAYSNAIELKQKLETLANRLYENHGIDLVFINSPLLATTAKKDKSSTTTTSSSSSSSNHQPRVWWEEEKEEAEYVHANTNACASPESDGESSGQHDDENDCGEESNNKDPTCSNDNENSNNHTAKKKYIGLDASLLLLRQIWTSIPYWGILAVGQATSIASFLPLLGISPTPSFCIFLEGSSLLEEDELLINNLPCLHIVGTNPSESTEKLIHQFGGEVSAGIPSLGRTALNRIGKFLVARKKDLRQSQQDINVLALQNQLHFVERQAANLVAQEIANDPPKALMAVISPRNVGGFHGTKRRGPNEEGGGAPCPSEFLLQREKRTTNPNGPTRQHPSQQN